jgi:endonuclease YncB( thermonuclease family)
LSKAAALRFFPLAFPLLLAALPASADVLARVVSVHDGDSLTVLVENRRMKIRLKDIDAPELGQPFGARSRQSLSELCHGKLASVEVRSRDRYQRAIARVTCAGTDANAEQVRRGYAWAYTRYARRDSPLFAFEGEARTARRGLWTDPTPVAPWEWRRIGREGYAQRPRGNALTITR